MGHFPLKALRALHRTLAIGLVVSAALCTAAPGARAGGPISVRLAERARVSGERIRLADIAGIRGGEKRAADRLGSLDLGPSPAPSASRRIDARYVRSRMRQQGWTADARLSGASAVEVVRSYIRIPAAKIEEAAAEYLHRNLPWEPEKTVVHSVRVNGDAVLPKGKVSYRISAPPHSDYLGTIPLTVAFSVDGKVVERNWAIADVGVLEEVAVTVRPLARYQRIEKDAVRSEKRDLAELPHGVIVGADSVVGKRVRHPLAPGTVLRSDMVEVPPLVDRGDVVTIVARSGVLTVTARGVVRENGHRGSRISVENVDSEKRVYARVVDESTVEVDF